MQRWVCPKWNEFVYCLSLNLHDFNCAVFPYGATPDNAPNYLF